MDPGRLSELVCVYRIRRIRAGGTGSPHIHMQHMQRRSSYWLRLDILTSIPFGTPSVNQPLKRGVLTSILPVENTPDAMTPRQPLYVSLQTSCFRSIVYPQLLRMLVKRPMLRPCFLVIDRETSTGISTRKLIIETAKFNVITAYSSREAILTLERFPALDGVVTDSGMTDMDCDQLLAALKAIKPEIPCIVVDTPRGTQCTLADYTLDTFDPARLLETLQKLHPKASLEIERRNVELERAHFNRSKQP